MLYTHKNRVRIKLFLAVKIVDLDLGKKINPELNPEGYWLLLESVAETLQ